MSNENTELATVQTQINPFSTKESFEHIQRVATMFSKSDMIPKRYINNIGNCIIAIEMATRMNANIYTEHSCLFLSNKLEDTINFIQDDVNDVDSFTSNGRNYHWYWVIIKMKLNDETGGEIVKVFDKNGNETDERIMLDLD